MPDDQPPANDSTNTWDLLSQFAKQREQLDPFLLRAVLANALRRRGFAAIVWTEDGKPEESKDTRAGVLFTWMIIWGFGVCATEALNLPWFAVPLAMLVVGAGLGLLVRATNESTLVGALIAVTWVAVGIVEIFNGSSLALGTGYLLPLGLGLVYGLANRLLHLGDAQDVAFALAGVVRSAPLVAPVVLLVLFLPALNADVWRVAGELTTESMILIGALSVGLLFIVVRLQLGGELRAMIAQRSEHLSDSANRALLTREQVGATRLDEADALLDGMTDTTLDASWPVAGEEYAPYLQTAVGGVLLAPLTARLAVTITVTGVLFSAYIYLLCAAVIGPETASEWSGVTTPTTDLEILGVSIQLVGGPYLHLAALLGLAATATFLSFALVEIRFAKALTDALLRDPTDRFLVIALPYLKLWEEAIEMGRRNQVATDPTQPPQEEAR